MLGEVLGRGGMGTVRQAADPALGRDLAIKFLKADDSDAAAQFVEEAQITSQLQHPNIVPVYDLGTDASGRPWLAMKRIDGESLADLITSWKRAKRGRLQAEDYTTILGTFNKVCDALAYAHSRGVIHRDIKPANIMVGEFGEVLLVDWGLAKPLASRGCEFPEGNERKPSADFHNAPASTHPGVDFSTPGSPAHPSSARPVRSSRRELIDDHTLDGDVFGTPAFMSPEQADGRTDEIDDRSDIFSLGGVLYQMLTLEPPYSGRSAGDTVANAARHRLAPPRKRAPAHRISKELQAIVLKAMAADPRDRYQSVRELQADLAAWQAYRRTTAWRPGPVARIVKWARRHPTASTSCTLLLIASLLVAVLASQLRAATEAADAARSREELATARANAAEHHADTMTAERDELGVQMRRLLDQQSRTSIAEFRRRWQEARRNGLSDEAFGRALTEVEAAEYLRAFNALFEVHRILKSEPTAEQCFCRALIRYHTGDMDGAGADYDAALHINPRFAEACYNRGLVRLAQNRLDEAIADFDAALLIKPDFAEVYGNRGNARHAQGRLDEAIADYDAALRINPQDTRAYTNRGNVHQAQGRLNEAIADYDTALGIDPQNASAHNNRGLARAAQGRLDEAFANYDAALRINPQYAEAYFNRGSAHQARGRLDEAIADYGAALRINPQFIKAYNNRGNALQAQGRLEEAIADYDAALRINPQHWQAWRNRAAATQSTDRPATIDALQKAYACCPVPADRDRIAGFIRALGGQVPDGK